MKINFIKHTDLEAIEANSKIVLKRIFDGGETLAHIFDDDKIIQPSNIDVPEFSLLAKDLGNYQSDVENVLRLYNNMSILSPSQATDPRIWTAYALDIFKDYMHCRYSHDESRYFILTNTRASLLNHGISRLWWLGYLLIDESGGEPNKYLEYVLSHDGFTDTLFARNFATSKQIMKEILSACINFEKTKTQEMYDLYDDADAKFHLSLESFEHLLTHVDIIGGTCILDTLPSWELFDQCTKFLHVIANMTIDK